MLSGIQEQQFQHAEGVSIQDTYTFDVDLQCDDFKIKVAKTVSGNFSSPNFKMLIGMDIISLGDFFFGQCRDPNGKIVSYFSFAIPSIDRKIDFAKERQDGKIRRDGKQQIIRKQPQKKQPKSKR